MKLNIFNSWKDYGRIYGRDLTYQTTKPKNTALFATYIKDAKTGNIVVKAYGRDKETSQQAAEKLLRNAGAEAVWNAAETGQSILKVEPKPEKDINWRDGPLHSDKAHRKMMVGENKEEPTMRNFVAKHARKVNKAGPMRDKKNDYKRKEKHKKRDVE